MTNNNFYTTLFICVSIVAMAHACSTAAIQRNETERMKACIDSNYSYDNGKCTNPP